MKWSQLLVSKLTALENLHSELFCNVLNLKLIMILETSKNDSYITSLLTCLFCQDNTGDVPACGRTDLLIDEFISEALQKAVS